MFELVGHDIHEGDRQREALAAGVTASLLATACCMGVAVLAAIAAGEVHAPTLEPDEMTWVEPEEAIEVLIAPAPPAPPAIRRARQGDAEAAPDTPAEPEPLTPEPAKELATERADAGTVDGASTGAATGSATGVLDGVDDGVDDGRGERRVRVVHHRDLRLLRQPHPAYPTAAWSLESTEHHCVATVHIAPDGRPSAVAVTGCPEAFHAPTQRTLSRWRWQPLDPAFGSGGVQTRVRITFRR